MGDRQSLVHTKWECKHRVGFIRKCRRKALYRQLRESSGRLCARCVVLRVKSSALAGMGAKLDPAGGEFYRNALGFVGRSRRRWVIGFGVGLGRCGGGEVASLALATRVVWVLG